MHVVSRLRLVLVRRPWIWWLAVVVTAALAASAVASSVRRLDETRRSWGEQATVWVASSAASPGEALQVEGRTWPRAMIPPDAVTTAPLEAIARQHIGPGEVIVTGDVATGGLPGLVPPGWVAVPVAQRSSVAHAGDAVAAYPDGQHLADGVVVAVGDDQVVVAVPADAAPAVTQAIPGGAVVIGLVGPSA